MGAFCRKKFQDDSNLQLSSDFKNLYTNENKIEGYGNPIPLKQLKDIIEKGENAMVKINYNEVKGTGFFFKQNIPSIKFNNKYFLMTNNHILNKEFLNNNTHLEIEYKNNQKIIPLNNRIKHTNALLDFTIIEILPTDDIFSEIKYFFTIDNYIMSNDSEFKYLNQDICIFQYPNGGELSFDKGQIKSINHYLIKHLVSTEPGSSGSPILLLNDFTIIGIHQAGNKNKEDNKGIFMKNILNDINNINSEKNNLNDYNTQSKSKIKKDNHANSPLQQLIDKLKKGENATVKIEHKFGISTGFFFKQNIASIKYNNKYFLMTNNHVLNQDFLNNNTDLEIEYKNKQIIIPLNNRIKYTNEKLDFTIIEILPTDDFFSKIKFFFTIDNYIMSNNSQSKYLKKKDICIFQYANREELSFDKGQIKSINDYKIDYLVSTYPGSSGSPILLLNNFTIIGIHGGTIPNENVKRGIFMKNILNDINNINSEEN